MNRFFTGLQLIVAETSDLSFSKINYTTLFNKDFKRLSKRYRTLGDDLQVFIKTQLYIFHILKIDNDGIKQIIGLKTRTPSIFKGKKFACKSLKGKGAKSGIRIIYAYFEKESRIEFLEIYYKGEKERENKERKKNYLEEAGEV